MAFDFHYDRDKYFQLQYRNTTKSIIPFIEEIRPVKPGLRVLEVGCRDGGVLQRFLELGCHVTGFDLDEGPILAAKQRYDHAIKENKAAFFVKNVHDYIRENRGKEEVKYDLIILKDVIEHIHDHQHFFSELRHLLKPKGIVFFGFPPWMNPFGGHQQVLANKYISKVPYIHLLPNFIYFNLLSWVCPRGVPFAKDVKATRISIERFERLVKENGFRAVSRNLYLIAPMYEHKFGMKPRKQFFLMEKVPWLRNLFTTNADYIVEYLA